MPKRGETAWGRRKRLFSRRSTAAIEGRHLPSLPELLLGMPFFGDCIEADAAEFAERVLTRVSEETAERTGLKDILGPLTMAPRENDFRNASQFFSQVRSLDDAPSKIFALRCDYYAAASGCRESAAIVAAETVSLTVGPSKQANGEAFDYCSQALGWLFVASHHLLVLNDEHLRGHWLYADVRDYVGRTGRDLIYDIIEGCEENERQIAKIEGDGIDQKLIEAPTDPHQDKPSSSRSREGVKRQRGVIVFRELGNKDSSEGKRVAREFGDVVNKHLPLVPVPDIRSTAVRLYEEFPYATDIVQTILTELSSRSHVFLRPTIFVGPPGCGKTRFAAELFKALGVPQEIYSCGGVSDSSIAGTARRWSSGEPSIPVTLIQRFKCASPGIILDEIEKVGTSKHNGSALDALLGLLERQSAEVWRDPYIESAVDLSHVIWLATANSLEGLSAPLRDRCRLIMFPEPGVEHLPALAARLLIGVVRDRSLDDRWALPLTGEELCALRRSWPGGSIRRLQRLVEGVLDFRERMRTAQ
ncbi:AAA family ATPase [Inquilinus sp. CAU 1745]|uniref:AAA family ATPase n=1 Tax=Inquilinus sp. CAU 1745 TaxID=3140369 RepID=UPI00325AB0A6